MKNFKQWIADKLFDLLTWLSPTEQPTPGEFRAWALEEAQKPPQTTEIWIAPAICAYPQQPQKIVNPRGRYFLSHRPRLVQFENLPPVIRTNTEPIDLATNPPDWLVGVNDPTAKVPAIKKQAYQEYQKRHAG